MAPPLIPDFPLLTATGAPPASPSPSALRDPLTGTAISPTPLSTADHIRQRLKLVRLERTLLDPVFTAIIAETRDAKREVRYAALHAKRLAEARRARADRARRREQHPDPFAAWDTFRVLPADVFWRPEPPASVVLLTGIPTLAEGYGAVCMKHPLREDLLRPGGRGVPVFAGEVTVDMGFRRRFDPLLRRARAERFDAMRVERAVYLAAKDGKRDAAERCLRCRVSGLPCSFERRRGREKKVCEGCRRNGCRFCLGVVLGGSGTLARKDGRRYVTVRKTRGSGTVDVVVYVREAEEVDVAEVREYAEELMDEKGLTFCGTTLDAGAAVLPSWKDAYCTSLAQKRELDNAFVKEWTGQETQQEAIDREGVTWKDYFRLLDEQWRRYNPYQPREPRPRRLLPRRGCLP